MFFVFCFCFLFFVFCFLFFVFSFLINFLFSFLINFVFNFDFVIIESLFCFCFFLLLNVFFCSKDFMFVGTTRVGGKTCPPNDYWKVFIFFLFLFLFVSFFLFLLSFNIQKKKRTLPSFEPYDLSARSGGFVMDRFLTGVRPQVKNDHQEEEEKRREKELSE